MRDELRAVPGPNLRHRPVDVGLRGEHTDGQFPGDVLVALALGGEDDDLTFAGCQDVEVAEIVQCPARGRPAGAQPLDQGASRDRLQCRITGSDPPDR